MAKASGGRGCVLGLMLVLGCNSELPPQNHIEATEIFMIRNVVEPGPLDPDRFGPEIAGPQMPIAEALPGDLVRLEAVVVDTDGRVLDPDELETLWLQCGDRHCDAAYAVPLEDWTYENRCDEIHPYDLNSRCQIGVGTGHFEFELPELSSYGSLLGFTLTRDVVGPRLYLYGVVAWGGKSAQACWESRRGDRADLDNCGFIYHHLALGPIWWLYDYAAAQGIEPPLDPSTFPEVVLLQPANRIPRPPTLTIEVDGELAAEGSPPLDPIAVVAGSRVQISLTFDPLSQLFQSSFEPVSVEATNAFIVIPERLFSRTATSGWIYGAVSPGDTLPSPHARSYEVDPDALAGSSRVLIGYHDDRGGQDYVSVEFELQ